MTVAIAFAGGTYGTYLEWCLTTLVSGKEIKEPFTGRGSSHGFAGYHVNDIDGWRNYVCSDLDYQFVRLHPKTKTTESITANMLEIAKEAQQIIYLYPDQSTVLLVINNWFYKISDNWMEILLRSDLSKIYDNWPVKKDTPTDQLPRWVLREFLSLYLMPAWYDQVEWNHASNWSHPKSLLITVSDLLFDFENTLVKIQKFCNLDYQIPTSRLLPSHEKNMSLQKYLGQDQLCKKIVESSISGEHLDWTELPLPSESWIQWQFRNLGYEIRCDGLDTFPTNSLQLKELLYPL